MSHALTRRLSFIANRNTPTTKRRQSLLRHLSRKFGFVYFGRVDQHGDDHHVVRGVTVSPSHEDLSYLVGSYDGQDITLVDRFDIVSAQKRHASQRWLIAEVPLTSPQEIPHFFLLPLLHDHGFHEHLTTLRSFEPVAMPPEYPADFQQRYTLYAAPARSLELLESITPDIARAIAVHFWPLSIEVSNGCVYVYSSISPLTTHEVERLIKNSTWIAQALSIGIASR